MAGEELNIRLTPSEEMEKERMKIQGQIRKELKMNQTSEHIRSMLNQDIKKGE